MRFRPSFLNLARTATTGAALAVLVSCTRTDPPPAARTFDAPESAVRALVEAAKAKNLDDVVAIFGPDGRSLVDSSDPATARRNRQVFAVAVAERWQLADQTNGSKVLVIGNEAWPFPIPLVKDANGWRFDTAAGKEEVLDRRIGRNELAVIRIEPHLRRCSAPLCQQGTRWSARGTICEHVRERAGPPEWPLLADPSRREAQSAR